MITDEQHQKNLAEYMVKITCQGCQSLKSECRCKGLDELLFGFKLFKEEGL